MSNITQSITTTQTTPLQGWTSSPNSRGTPDILNSALLTTLLCTWSILYIGINSSPPTTTGTATATTSEKTESNTRTLLLQQTLLPKLKLAFLCIIGPDFLLYLAIGQWESARRSCVQFRGLGSIGFKSNEEGDGDGEEEEGKGKEGKDRWTMRHAFLADMGGFTLQTKDSITWPLDANQLFWLIQHNFFSESTIQEEILIPTHEIEDRNKQDSLLRLFTLLQIIWFLITCIGRAWQDLAISTLELTTLGFVTTTIGVLGFWWFKPADVSVSRVLRVEATVGEILEVVSLDDGGDDGDKEVQRVRKRERGRYYWFETPLDFLNPEKTYFQVGWRYTFNLLLILLHIPRDRSRPIKRRSDDNFPVVSKYGVAIVVIAGLCSWGINFAAWNFTFPSLVERALWRGSSVILISTITIGEVYHEILLKFFPDLKRRACERFAEVRFRDMEMQQAVEERGRDPRDLVMREGLWRRILRRWRVFIQWLPNNSANHDPAMTVPLVVVFPALFCAGLYFVARVFVLVEDLIAFRAQPSDVFMTVDWSGFLPHF